MVTRLPDSVLYQIAVHSLTTLKSSSLSWFLQIRELCILYLLTTDLTLFHTPLSKASFKNLIKSKVTDYWECKLREEAAALPSLTFFRPEYMSQKEPHPLWLTCSSNAFEVNKAVVQARMLSGMCPTDKLSRHWTVNKNGYYLIPDCSGNDVGSLEHMLLL